MMPLHDTRDPNVQMDTTSLQSPSNTLSLAYPALVPQRPEDPLIQNTISHTSRDAISIFQRPVDPNALHLSLADTSPSSAAIHSMDVLDAPTSSRAPAPGFISDFPRQNISYAALSRMDSHLALHSPQSTTSGSSGPSSAAHGVSSAYTMNTSSIMDSGFIFPPPDVPDSFNGRDSSPETPGDSHLLVVGDILKSIAHTAQSASTACSRGQGLEANVRIDELKKTITLVSELIAATKIADTPAISRNPSPRRFSVLGAKSSVSPSLHGAVTLTQEQMGSGMHFASAADIGTMDGQSNGDISDMSRKRCASSMAGDRVIKAPKREPQEDTPLHIIPPPVSNQSSFSSAVAAPMTDIRSAASYVPANASADSTSQPTSSAGQPPLAGYGLISHQPPAASMSYSIPGSSAQPPSSTDFISTSPLSTTMPHSAHFPPPPTVRTSWSDGAATLPHRSHQHSLSGSSLNAGINFHSIPNTGSSLGPLPFSTTGTFPSSSSQPRSLTNSGTGITPPIGRVSRSGSFTTGNPNPFAFGISEVNPSNALDFLHSAQHPTAQSLGSHSPTSSLDGEHDESDVGSHSHSPPESSGPRTSHHSSSSRNVTGHDARSGHLVTRQSAENLSPTSAQGHSNEVPQEYRAEVDRIFFEFLNSICSNLDATDAKGEPIHQTLMAKKMQRLDESPDFRPFKFRIQAFTNAFLEELAKQGYPEEKIPMKKIRNYLWNQPYISRFNEDGKKTKSKGNHIWNIDAKKSPHDGTWTFRPFHRKVAGSPPGVAYVGLRWSWAPRIWDPQASRSNLIVTYGSPSLPSWLFWEDDVLSGTPPPEAESCDITVVARYVQDGQEELLTQTFHLNIVPVSNLDTSFSASRRGSMNGEMHKPRRVASDSTVPQTSPRTLRSQPSSGLVSPVATRDAQVIQVLQSAAQRVAQEAQSQIISSATQGEHGPELQALAKQQHVLTITAQAFDQEVTGQQRSEIGPQATTALAAAAQQVVFQAARQVVADRSAAVASQISAGFTPSPDAATQVTVNEVSVATQSAVAQAVEITGPLSNEVDVLMTASSLLQQQIRAPALIHQP
ncbi:hypothetical protein DEU56DRAFT_763573 [Suillus clintonianus]|uniref:uncharacterized protein n=1 Tax=Suillus clintonianus TaxID=1904413 RepID=UPI001B872C81|nr:uncharacterized protein DEU56DRAFT_763573 [Suillus clintonianus]KAG2157230.1 hypothetical protein DEU56DRAFT_763573 [Suillus clintonianus]